MWWVVLLAGNNLEQPFYRYGMRKDENSNYSIREYCIEKKTHFSLISSVFITWFWKTILLWNDFLKRGRGADASQRAGGIDTSKWIRVTNIYHWGRVSRFPVNQLPKHILNIQMVWKLYFLFSMNFITYHFRLCPWYLTVQLLDFSVSLATPVLPLRSKVNVLSPIESIPSLWDVHCHVSSQIVL